MATISMQARIEKQIAFLSLKVAPDKLAAWVCVVSEIHESIRVCGGTKSAGDVQLKLIYPGCLLRYTAKSLYTSIRSPFSDIRSRYP